jgi:hypothetical protein
MNRQSSGRLQRLVASRRPRRCTRLQTQVREDLLDHRDFEGPYRPPQGTAWGGVNLMADGNVTSPGIPLVLAGRLMVTLPRFHVHQIVVAFLMNGGRDGQEGSSAKPAVHH